MRVDSFGQKSAQIYKILPKLELSLIFNGVLERSDTCLGSNYIEKLPNEPDKDPILYIFFLNFIETEYNLSSEKALMADLTHPKKSPKLEPNFRVLFEKLCQRL